MAVKPRYRLMIEGAPTEWVTDSSLETTVTDGRVRRQGLMYDGLEIREELDLRESVTNVSGMTIRIVSKHADAEFAQRANVLAILGTDEDESNAIFQIEDNTGLISVDDVIHLGTEACKVTTVSTTYIGVTRQYWDTQSQGHYKQVGEYYEVVPIFDRVPSYEGRRVYLFRYDEGDTSDQDNLFDFTVNDDGRDTDTSDTVVWRGVISRPPRLHSDALTWLLDVEPITFLLEQEMAKHEVSLAIKGIYHHAWSGLYIRCMDYDASPDELTETTVRGFYPTEEDFISAINGALATLRTSAFTYNPESIRFSWNSEVGYKLELHTNPSNAQEINIEIFSPLLGATGVNGRRYLWAQEGDGEPLSVGAGAPLAADSRYYKYIDGAVTRSVLGTPEDWVVIENTPGDRVIIGDPTYKITDIHVKVGIHGGNTEATYPPMRMYVDHDPGPLMDTGAVLVAKGQHGGSEYTVTLEVTGTGTDGTYDVPYVEVKSPTRALPIKAGTEINILYTYGSYVNVSGMINNVISEAVDSNKGGTPFIKYSDVSALSIVALSAALPTDWQFWFTSPHVLRDIIKEHLKLYGWCMHLNSVGQLAFFKVEPPTLETAAIDATIDSDVIITPPGGDFPRWEPAIDGIVSVVEIARGYDWREDEFTESETVAVRDVTSISTHKNRSRGTTKIEARGAYLSNLSSDIPISECYRLATNYLSMHKHDYDVIELDVLSSIFDSVLCGSIVKVTSPHIPNTADGTRGVTDRPGLVIGRRYSLDPSNGAAGKLTIRLEREQPTGYAPSLRVTEYTVYSGLTYTCTITENYHGPDGYDDIDFFAVGDLIRVIEFDSGAAPSSESGEVAALVSTTEIRVTMDGSFPASGLGLWDIVFQNDTGSLATAQTNYCYVADSNGLLYDGTIGRRFR